MRPALRSLFLPAILSAACPAFLPSPARAEWTPRGNPICTATGLQEGANLISDGSGGAFVLWMDRRRGSTLIDLYATRILADGSIAPGWPVNGMAVAATGRVTAPSAGPDGAGGLLAFWFDQTDYKPRMQHVDGSGALAPGFAADGNILPMTIGGPTGYVVRAVQDGAGGAYFLWNAFNGVSDVLYLTRLTSSGGFVTGWSASGVPQASSDGFDPSLGFSSIVLASDPFGGALVTQTHSVDGGCCQPNFPVGSSVRTNADGTAGFGASQYPPVVNSPISIVADAAGGAFCSWLAGNPTERRMQHYLSNGSATWPTPTPAPVGDALLRDGAGGLYLFGKPLGADRLELHRRASDASTPSPWTASGFVLTTESYWGHAAVRSGDLVFACWSSGLGAEVPELRAAAVTPDGALAPGWPAGGMSITDVPTSAVIMAMMPMPPSDVLIAWRDARSGDVDIYVTLLEPAGPVTLDAPREPRPSALAYAAAPVPNPARDLLHLALLLPEDSGASLELVDVTGRVVERQEVNAGAGRQSASFDVSRLPAGLYWARLRQAGRTAAARFSVVH